MLLTVTLKEKQYNFEVIPLMDESNEKVLFFVQVIGHGSMIAEKQNPGGIWVVNKGDSFDPDLNSAIYEAINNASVTKLMRDAIPLSELNG